MRLGHAVQKLRDAAGGANARLNGAASSPYARGAMAGGGLVAAAWMAAWALAAVAGRNDALAEAVRAERMQLADIHCKAQSLFGEGVVPARPGHPCGEWTDGWADPSAECELIVALDGRVRGLLDGWTAEPDAMRVSERAAREVATLRVGLLDEWRRAGCGGDFDSDVLRALHGDAVYEWLRGLERSINAGDRAADDPARQAGRRAAPGPDRP